MSHEVENPGLLQEALNIQKKIHSEQDSIKEAKKRIPELRQKALKLLGIESEESESHAYDSQKDRPFEHKFDLKKGDLPYVLTDEKAWNTVTEKILKKYQVITQTFLVPVSDESNIEVKVTKDSDYSDNIHRSREDVTVDIEPLDFILRIYKNQNSVIESKAHNFKPTNPFAPIGPASSRGLEPVWKRDMNMQDFENFNAVFDRLGQPDVIIKDL